MPVSVGPQTLADGNGASSRGGRTGEAIVQNLHGLYYESCFRGVLYNGAIVGQVTTVGTNTTYTGLCLSNPIASTVNVVLNKVGWTMLVANAAAAAVGLMTGYHASTNVTHTTPVTPRTQKYTGSGGGTALLDSSATLPATPTLNTILGGGTTAAITTSPACVGGLVDLDGSIILVPGAFVALYTSTASGTASMAISFTWEEVPV